MHVDALMYLSTTNARKVNDIGVENYLLMGDTTMLNLDDEGNDIMWNRQFREIERMMSEHNQKKPGTYPGEGKNDPGSKWSRTLSDYVMYMVDVQKLTPPGEH